MNLLTLVCSSGHARKRSINLHSIALGLALVFAANGSQAFADAPAPAAPPPPPYSIPWQLRPIAAITVLRTDTAIAFYKNPVSDESGTTVASMLLAAYKLTDSFSPMLRLGIVSNSPPGAPAPAAAPPSGTVMINPVIGGTYVLKLSPEFKVGLFLGVTIPIGGGGGDTPDPGSALAARSGILARSAMDNAMFAVNDFTIFPGVGIAFVKSGFTVQAEATLLQLFRVRGDAVPAMGLAKNPDSSKTNMTMGLHLGYFVIPQLSVAAELRHQRWLSTPVAVKNDMTDSIRDNTTVALGVRAHFKVGETMWIRPGISYSRGLDDPMSLNEYNILQLDIPVIF